VTSVLVFIALQGMRVLMLVTLFVLPARARMERRYFGCSTCAETVLNVRTVTAEEALDRIACWRRHDDGKAPKRRMP